MASGGWTAFSKQGDSLKIMTPGPTLATGAVEASKIAIANRQYVDIVDFDRHLDHPELAWIM